MDDPVVRLLAAAAIVLVGVAASLLSRRRQRMRTADRSLDVSAFRGRVLLFTDSRCRSCRAARHRLGAAGVAFDEIAHDHEPEMVAAAGVTGVPLLVVRDPAGTIVGRIAGRVRRRELSGILRRAGL